VQTVEHRCHVVVDEGFLGVPETQWTTQPFVDGVLGQAGLEHVLEAQGFFLIGDVEQVGAIPFQVLELHLLGGQDAGEVGLDAVVLQGPLDGDLGFTDHLLLVELIDRVGDEHHVLGGVGYVLLHQVLEVLGKVAPVYVQQWSLITVRSITCSLCFHIRPDYIITYSAICLGANRFGSLDPTPLRDSRCTF